jgi:hypothetical protein
MDHSSFFEVYARANVLTVYGLDKALPMEIGIYLHCY